MDIKTEYIVAGLAGLVAGAKFVDVKIAGAFAAGVFIVGQDANVIIAFVVGYIAGMLLVRRISASSAQA